MPKARVIPSSKKSGTRPGKLISLQIFVSTYKCLVIYLCKQILSATLAAWVAKQPQAKLVQINSAGGVTCDRPAEILVLATSQTCRDMSKFSENFQQLCAAGDEKFLYWAHDH